MSNKNLLNLIKNTEVEWKPLGEISNIKRGKRVTKSELSLDGKYPVYSGGTTPMGYFNNFNNNANTIIIAKYGTAGFVNFITEKFWANDVCYCVIPNEKLENKFLFFYLKNLQIFIQSKATEAIPAHLPTEAISNLPIPIPPIEIQNKIVNILDKFTHLTSELTSELTSRNKQYEYYRDKLLNFNNDATNRGGGKN